ncbi:MAG: cystathionine gamma-synthase [Flavobacteriaceae bacterium]|nr:cystathionine gamma-synthase [Flavobacteriaceae bacterium]|tara:strand:- start:145 stop:1284 length:1140 start_codon:yes stop_codon:yes gene_type:complete
MKFNTKTIHGGQKIDPAFNSVMQPIYQTSTYAQKSPGVNKGFEYSRTHNPTRTALQNSFASLENAKYGVAFSSGLAAIDAIIKLLSPGDEVISTNDLYGGTFRLFTKIFEKYGVKFHFTSLHNITDVESLINENTKVIWAETPTNPMINVFDIEALSKISKSNNLILVVDNTFASPYLQNPLNLGADIVMHSATKYLAGHSDVVLGALMLNDYELAEKLYFIQNSSGAVPGPQDCFLTLRGIKTLHVRIQRHCENAHKVAHFLNDHKMVEKVYWPGLESHKNHEVAKKQMSDFGGMLSFRIKDYSKEQTIKFLEKLHLFTLAESLGGVESLCGHPATMTHASIPKEEREKSGVTDSLIRLSVGIEDADDLIDDLKNAFL